MTKEFVNYEQALALKELGFNEHCFGYYADKTGEDKTIYTVGQVQGSINSMSVHFNSVCSSYQFSAPLYQQAFKWIREKYNLYAEICLDSYKEPYSLKVTIKHLDDTNTFVDKEYYPYSNGIGDIDNKKYEEAEQACLDKLIEICKTKQD